MHTQAPADLLGYLHDESVPIGEMSPDDTAGAVEVDSSSALRVPLELEGAIWSAIVERIANRSIQLIVDRAAAAHVSSEHDAAIHYQPNNCAMQQASGRITRVDRLAGQKLRLNFELS